MLTGAFSSNLSWIWDRGTVRDKQRQTACLEPLAIALIDWDRCKGVLRDVLQIEADTRLIEAQRVCQIHTTDISWGCADATDGLSCVASDRLSFYRVCLDGWLVCCLGNWTFWLTCFCLKKHRKQIKHFCWDAFYSAQREPPKRGILGKVLVQVTYSSPLCISAEQLHLYKYHATLHSRPCLCITVTQRSATA